MLTIPNVLTLLRIAMVPVLAGCYFAEWWFSGLLAGVIFGIAAATDWLDGYLARRLGQESNFGAFLDPVADKLIVACALVMLVASWQDALVTVCAMIIIAREFVVSGLREWLGGQGRRDLAAVGWWGKIKTTVQMIAIGVMFALPPGFGGVLEGAVLGLLVVATALSVQSMIGYLRAASGVLGIRS